MARWGGAGAVQIEGHMRDEGLGLVCWWAHAPDDDDDDDDEGEDGGDAGTGGADDD